MPSPSPYLISNGDSTTCGSRKGMSGRLHSELTKFEPTVMFFRLCNSPVMFQMMMDNILVYSHTLSNHQQIIHQVLSTLQEQRLFLKPEKCKFEQKEVEYLRLVISKDHVAMDLMKVHGVTEWLTPTKVKEVQSFLGFVNFYWKFICDFSDIAHCHKLQRVCHMSHMSHFCDRF